MVDISTFKRNAVAMEAGEWVNPGSEYGGIEIKAKALGFAYLDLQTAELRKAARRYGGEDRVPSETRAAINLDCMIRTALLDVRGLTVDDKPVSFEAFCVLLCDPAYGDLASVAFIACNMVGRQRAADMEDAAGNFAPPSAGS